MIISTDLAFNRYGHRSPTMSDVGWRLNTHLLFLQAAATGGECLIKVMNARIRGVDVAWAVLTSNGVRRPLWKESTDSRNAARNGSKITGF